MNLFGDKCLKEENRRLREENEFLKRLEKNNESFEHEELMFLRMAIKPYVEYRNSNWLGIPDILVNRTLDMAEKDIKNLNLYIAVLEGDLGLEKTASAKQKLEALKALGDNK